MAGQPAIIAAMARLASSSFLLVFVVLGACAPTHAAPSVSTADRGSPISRARAIEPAPAERHFASLRQLTFGGENAEAYFSHDGKWLTLQSTRNGHPCDQQYVMRLDGTGLRRISDGRGKTTCGWFFPGDERLFFACDGANLKRLTHNDVYTAEAVLSPDGKRIVFTSLKDGDLDIYTMNADGSDVRRLTNTPGYDGGGWWSPDGKKIVYRANHPTDSTELKTYRDLLAQRLVRPAKVELFVMNADGSDQRQITQLGGANFGPSWTPDGKRIIFSSNYLRPRSGNFDLFLVNPDGTGLEQITFDESFDGFPMFSPDGRQIVWASNRHADKPGETNVFIANWR